jgi:hypothetical protein
MLEHKMKAFDIEITNKSKDISKLTKKELSEIMTTMYTSPSGSNSSALCALHDSVEWGAMLDRLKKVNAEVMDGDLSCAEELLIDQAIVLQSIFSNYIGKTNNSEYLSQVEAYSKIALRAQNQCQRTLKTLLEFKNPKRSTFIKQQNNAVNQQINEGEPKEIPEKEIKSANELLEHKDGTWLDTGKTKEAVRADTEVETLGELDRTQHGTG